MCARPTTLASYAAIETEARVVQRIYDLDTVEGLSIGAIARRLNEDQVPTRKKRARWQCSVIWAVLRNPAYRGVGCFGKTRGLHTVAPPGRCVCGRDVQTQQCGHERPREERIEIPVPALVTEERFARAQELLQENKVGARRRTTSRRSDQ